MTRQERFADAYLEMALQAKYRPVAPGDGCGGVYLSREEIRDEDRLRREAIAYSNQFEAEDSALKFHIGCSNYSTNRALVYLIEAARLLCGGLGDATARKLAMMAVAEIETANSKRGRKVSGKPGR